MLVDIDIIRFFVKILHSSPLSSLILMVMSAQEIHSISFVDITIGSTLYLLEELLQMIFRNMFFIYTI